MSSLIEILSQTLVQLLSVFHRVTQTYWLDIILLTLLVRFVLGPVYRMQTRTMRVMNELQPKLKELQAQYKEQPQELNTRMMQLYKDHKVNPMMGCLPMLVQLPILVSMFSVLRSPLYYKLLPGFEQSSLFGARLTVRCFEGSPFPDIESLPGMVDLGSIFHWAFFFDKFLYLPALPLFAVYVATTILQTKQMQTANPQSKSQSNQMNYMMPLLLWFGLIFPVGLLLYWGLSNVIQMQTYASTKHPAPAKKNVSATENPEGSEPHEPPPLPKKKRRKKK